MISIFLIIIGLILRTIAIKSLDNKEFWRLQSPLKLVTTGIYEYIRHPMYLGTFILYSGILYLLTNSLSISAAIMLILVNFTMQRVDIEEHILEETFGYDFIKYKQNTKRFIPFII